MKRPELHHSRALVILLPVIKVLAWLIFAVYGGFMSYKNRGRTPKRGGLLIFSNHISNIDPVLVQFACRRPVHFMARRDLFTMGFLGKLVRWFRAFPVTQSSADKGALKTAIDLIEDGRAVVIFPEGQLSEDGLLRELLPGSSLIVRKTGVTCQCVGISGTDALMPFGETKMRRKRASLHANWGEPKSFPPKASAEEIMSWINAELHALTGQPQKQTSPTSNEAGEVDSEPNSD
ncbi:MAG: 1-acyl-sn-glycerol-3-phosphate acyltransferase [Armatimonadetes bacterium]|nr:1-acyl-sn-glycerol-3-phosphate acyltransferase [Armatimonadota bacterium]